MADPGDILGRADGDSDPVANALQEDLGAGDLSAEFFLPAGTTSIARMVARKEGILAGGEAATRAFRLLDPNATLTGLLPDGTKVVPGQSVLEIQGETRSLLSAERTALNFLQQLSGVATLTAKFVDAVRGTSCRIFDTRKTVPGLRSLQKAAVLAGGGCNHRMGLYDMVMIKDNHLAASGSLEHLADSVQAFHRQHPEISIAIEADTVEQVEQFFQIPGLQLILLDNMSLSELSACVARKPSGIELEASGGIRLDNVREVAETGVDRISVGALTHSAPALDFGLDFVTPDSSCKNSSHEN